MSVQSNPLALGVQKRRRDADPYESGYARGHQAAGRYVASLRARKIGNLVAPNEMAYEMTHLISRVTDAGASAEHALPQAGHNPQGLAALGEFHGFCAGVMQAL